MDALYEFLLGLPLFNGVSKETMLQVVGKTKLHFLKYSAGETIIRPGDHCTHLKFVISGSVRQSISNVDKRFTVSQTLKAPAEIAPEYIFGRVTKYPCEVVTNETTGIMQIAKADYLNILNSDPIFLFNYLNHLSMNAQKAVDGILAVATGSLEERIAFWIVALTQRNGIDITLSCKQRDLYSIFGVQRSSFIAALDDLKNRNIIDYSQNEIRIFDRATLVKMILSHSEHIL